MSRPSLRTLQGLTLATTITSLLWTTPGLTRPPSDKKQIAAARWNENTPGCTFSPGTDGKLRYGLWSGDVGITVAVDAQELEKVHRRHESFFAVLLEVSYRGQGTLNLKLQDISLEFVKHFQVEQTPIDPDGFSQKIQIDSDALNRQTAREIKKNPEKKEAKEAYLRAYLKDSAELQEFVGKSALRSAYLDPKSPKASGWVLFSTKNKWIGGWKKPEEFIFRVPLEGKFYEFPFTLPSGSGEVLLRKRQ